MAPLLCTDKDASNYSEPLPCRYKEDVIIKQNRPVLLNCPRDVVRAMPGVQAAAGFSIVDMDPGQGETLTVEFLSSPGEGTTFISLSDEFNGKDGKDVILTATPTDESQVGNYFVTVYGVDEDGNQSNKCVLSVIVDDIDGSPGEHNGVSGVVPPEADSMLDGLEAILPPALQEQILTTPGATPTVISDKGIKGMTSVNEGHSHEYEVDKDGNGWARDVVNPQEQKIRHRHQIINYSVATAQSSCYPECREMYNVPGAPPHVHTLPDTTGGPGSGVYGQAAAAPTPDIIGLPEEPAAAGPPDDDDMNGGGY